MGLSEHDLVRYVNGFITYLLLATVLSTCTAAGTTKEEAFSNSVVYRSSNSSGILCSANPFCNEHAGTNNLQITVLCAITTTTY